MRIGAATVRNRLYRAPVLEGAGDGPDAGAHYAKHFVENARHGVGLVIQGSSCIAPEGRISPGMTCVDTHEKVLRLGRWWTRCTARAASIFLDTSPSRGATPDFLLDHAQMLGMRGVCYNPEVTKRSEV